MTGKLCFARLSCSFELLSGTRNPGSLSEYHFSKLWVRRFMQRQHAGTSTSGGCTVESLELYPPGV
eukprot:scaffold3312_cov143-Skeletonema_marinoi.AAC.9